MSIPRALVCLLLAAACRPDDQTCSQGLHVSIVRASGPFEPGEYQLDIVLDDFSATVVCEAGADGLIDYCALADSGEFPRYPVFGLHAIDEGFTAMFFRVDDGHALCVEPKDMPQHASVTVRRGEQVLAAEAWAPHYRSCSDELCGRIYTSAHEIVFE